MPSVTAHPTPNPNSLKFTAEAAPFIDDGLISVRSPASAGEHPLGALIRVDGICDVLITPAFVTVSKTESASWDDLRPLVTSRLEAYLN